MFRKVLIANRGEIAVRIMKSLQEMGIRTVAIYSEPDRAAPHVAHADEAYPLDGVTSGETYLRGDRIIEIARQHGVDAIHPGYGFLAENAAFAQSCIDEGITFIGPKPDVIRAMGDKVIAKRAMEEAGVPVIPGFSGTGETDADDLAREAAAIGYPVLVKAAAGGGGKGMRVVDDPGELRSAVEAAQREANAAFGDARVFLEKYLARARHIEFQIFGDEHGEVVHLFERECSIQRRHQKIIEEAPSPAVTPELRAAMADAAVRAAKAIGYTNAGTVEFMVDDAGAFYFLEVNTRLQVEHPVTEMTVHHDLVRAQVGVAAGEPLPFAQAELRQDGHAIECRIYAEDPAHGFLPSTGVIRFYEPPAGPGIRVDSGVARGSEVTVHYDPMLAKLIAAGRSREDAIAKMLWALSRFVIIGVTTNIDFLRAVLQHDAFARGDLHTRYLEEHEITVGGPTDAPDEALIVAALAATRQGQGDNHRAEAEWSGAGAESAGPWQTAGAWRTV